ncbi:3465_t:CDS:1, partial [Funneliformis mosseae]
MSDNFEHVSYISTFLKHLSTPIPPYVLGCLPAIATIGASPIRGFRGKLMWVFRCLGCPFTGLHYTCNVSNDEMALCIYWIEAKYFSFIGNHDEEKFVDGKKISYRPVGMYFRKPTITREMEAITEECTAQASVLERLSSLAPAYYMGIGIFAGISRLFDRRDCEFWPHVPLALSWTIPAIFRRIIGGILVVKDPNESIRKFVEEHEKYEIYKVYEELKKHKRCKRRCKKFKKNKRKRHQKLANRTSIIPVKYADDLEFCYVILTGIMSIGIPWAVVILARFTPPIGCLCRCKYLSVLASIWSTNSFLAFVHHCKGEKSVI